MAKRKQVGKTVKCGGDGQPGCGSMFTPQGIGRHREKCSAALEGKKTPDPPKPPGEDAHRRKPSAPPTGSGSLFGSGGGLLE